VPKAIAGTLANRFPLQPDHSPRTSGELEEGKRKGEFPLLSALKLDECDYRAARTHENINLPAEG